MSSHPIGSGKHAYASDIILSTLARTSAAFVLLMMASLLFVLTKAAIPSIKKYGFQLSDQFCMATQ